MTRDRSVRQTGAPGSTANIREWLDAKSHADTARSHEERRDRASPDRGGKSDGSWTPPAQFDEYVLIRLLGQGSMGRVYLARDTVLDRPVAVKFIGNIAPDAEDRERFLVEARAVARLQHPNVVTIFRVGELEGHPYLITEYIAGKILSELSVPIAWRKVLELGIGLARGLAAAHRHGVLHRDIKLANAVLSESGEIKLLDFSLAKLLEPASVDLARPQPALADAVKAAMSAVERHGEHLRPRGDGDPTAGMSLESASLTQPGTLLGTPHYMAPELWRIEAGTHRSDVYALGVLLYILASGRPPTEADSAIDLATRVQEQEARPLLEQVPRFDPRLAQIIDRCLRRDPFERFGSAEDLLAALEALQPMRREVAIPEGNPYRGLQAFESKHRALFFGRAAEIRAVLTRLRSESLVVVAGDSGVGKSSLCKAGVVPLVEEGNLDHNRQWASATMTPGRYPLATLISTMAALFDMTEETMNALLGAGAEEFVRALRKQLGDARGRLLMIDQFEELATLGAPAEVAVVGPLLARLASGLPGLRVLATVRGDFLTRVAQLPGVGDELARAIYFLRPLAPEGMREAIVGPARAKAVGFETEALIDELIEAGSQGSLPLLQFALAELWEIRDQTRNIVSAADLTRIGGVSGALARHGDAALAELIPEQRAAARRILMRLVTVDDTRAVRSEEELVAGSAPAGSALKALVRSRLVIVREIGDQTVFEIAHEVLLRGWATLGTWLEEERESRAIHHRLELAVVDWERLGRGRDALWSGAPLQEVLSLDPATLRPKEHEFIAACRTAAARTRSLKRIAAVAVPLGVLLTYGGMWLKGQSDLRANVDAYMAAAAEVDATAEQTRSAAEALRTEAFAAYDRGETERGEQLWARHVALVSELEGHMARVAQQLETALSFAGWRDDVRERLLDALLRRALLVEQAGRGALAVQDQLERIRLYDTRGEHLARWHAPASLHVRSDPPGARVVLERYVDEDGLRRITRAEELGTTPLAPQTLERGSYRLRFALPGRASVLYPVLLARDERAELDVVLPSADTVPEGFVYIPAGPVLYGTGSAEEIRLSFNAEPLHRVETAAFLIGRFEVTYHEYLTYLAALPDERQRELLSSVASVGDGMRLTKLPQGGWQLDLHQGHRVYTARSGELLTYEGRTHRATVEWERLPVTGITPAEAQEFITWLDRSRRLPGARFCTEHEWERAARGADNRNFAGGDRLDPNAANISTTYGRVYTAFGPDPVGSYPPSESPFGLFDTAGNAYELTVSPHRPEMSVARGGAFFFDAFASRIANRFELPASFRSTTVGLRVCATWPLAR